MPDRQSITHGKGTSEVAAETGISAFTIRYYDRCGFFPHLIRGKRGVREFREQDVQRLLLVDALRKSGLSIEGIAYYVRLAEAEGTKEERRAILQQQRTVLELQRESIDECLGRLDSALRYIDAKSDDERADML